MSENGIVADYVALSEGTGESLASIAGRVESQGSHELAAELRKAHAEHSKREEAPKEPEPPKDPEKGPQDPESPAKEEEPEPETPKGRSSIKRETAAKAD